MYIKSYCTYLTKTIACYKVMSAKDKSPHVSSAPKVFNSLCTEVMNTLLYLYNED